MRRIDLRIADLTVSIRGQLDADGLGISPKMRPFFVPDVEQPDVMLSWVEGQPSSVPRGALVYDPGTVWRMYRGADGFGWMADVAYREVGATGRGCAALTADADWRACETVEQPSGPTWHSLINLGVGELIVRTRLIAESAVMFHSCGLDDHGAGILLAGHSGAGKSTQAGIWAREPGVFVMNDDRLVVRMRPDGPVLYGTPWGGTANIARNHSAPLKAIIVLEQDKDNAIEPMSAAAAIPAIAPRAFLPYWDPLLMAVALETIDRIVRATPVFRLRCRPEPEVVALVRSVL